MEDTLPEEVDQFFDEASEEEIERALAEAGYYDDQFGEMDIQGKTVAEKEDADEALRKVGFIRQKNGKYFHVMLNQSYDFSGVSLQGSMLVLARRETERGERLERGTAEVNLFDHGRDLNQSSLNPVGSGKREVQYEAFELDNGEVVFRIERHSSEGPRWAYPNGDSLTDFEAKLLEDSYQ